MAAAVRPDPSDARVPCPLCGGLIHPIAGKCKHCKADLTAYHAARPSANAPLPALSPAPGTNGHANERVNERVNAHTAHAPAALVVPMPVAATHDASQRVLPPRPSDQGYAAKPTASGWRSWPMLVIFLATVAIVIAVVLMVWPAGRRALDGKRAITPPPAPERMQTDPEIQTPLPVPVPQVRPAPPPTGSTQDPWMGQVDPPPPATGAGPLDTDIDDSDDLGGLTDPLASPHPPPADPALPRVQINGRGMMVLLLMAHICRKAIQCSPDDPMAQRTCDVLAGRPSAPPVDCPAAESCFQQIDTMSCGTLAANLSQLNSFVMQFRDCVDALGC